MIGASRALPLLLVCVLVGCATAAQREASRLAQETREAQARVNPCWDAVAKHPSAVALMDKSPPADANVSTPLALLADTSKPTAEQIRHVFAVHAEMQRCRKLTLESVGRIHPELVRIWSETYAAQDNLYLRLVKREVTWGENARALLEARRASANKLNAWQARITQQLANDHAYEIQQRQQAAQTLALWGLYLIQLEQQRQTVAPSAQPVTMHCNYTGPQQIHCVGN